MLELYERLELIEEMKERDYYSVSELKSHQEFARLESTTDRYLMKQSVKRMTSKRINRYITLVNMQYDLDLDYVEKDTVYKVNDITAKTLNELYANIVRYVYSTLLERTAKSDDIDKLIEIRYKDEIIEKLSVYDESKTLKQNCVENLKYDSYMNMYNYIMRNRERIDVNKMYDKITEDEEITIENQIETASELKRTINNYYKAMNNEISKKYTEINIDYAYKRLQSVEYFIHRHYNSKYYMRDLNKLTLDRLNKYIQKSSMLLRVSSSEIIKEKSKYKVMIHDTFLQASTLKEIFDDSVRIFKRVDENRISEMTRHDLYILIYRYLNRDTDAIQRVRTYNNRDLNELISLEYKILNAEESTEIFDRADELYKKLLA